MKQIYIMTNFRKIIEMTPELKKDLSIRAGHKEMSLNGYINWVLTEHSKNDITV